MREDASSQVRKVPVPSGNREIGSLRLCFSQLGSFFDKHFEEANAEMNEPARKIQLLAWGGLTLVIAAILLAFLVAQLKARTPAAKPLPIYGQVADFTLTNQNGGAVSLADLRGHPWVADIIFTRCPGPCIKMTRQMKQLQEALPSESQARLVSLTTDPPYDTPPVLKGWADKFGADPNRWLFLTGTKTQIANLAIDSLKLAAIEKKPGEREAPEDLFIHATIFVIVDKQAQLRGVFETTGDDVDPQKVKAQILAAVRQLEQER
jgi:protein SCO1/2